MSQSAPQDPDRSWQSPGLEPPFCALVAGWVWRGEPGPRPLGFLTLPQGWGWIFYFLKTEKRKKGSGSRCGLCLITTGPGGCAPAGRSVRGGFGAKVCRAWCILPGGPCGAGKLGQGGPGLLLSCRARIEPLGAGPSQHSQRFLAVFCKLC